MARSTTLRLGTDSLVQLAGKKGVTLLILHGVSNSGFGSEVADQLALLLDPEAEAGQLGVSGAVLTGVAVSLAVGASLDVETVELHLQNLSRMVSWVLGDVVLESLVE